MEEPESGYEIIAENAEGKRFNRKFQQKTCFQRTFSTANVGEYITVKIICIWKDFSTLAHCKLVPVQYWEHKYGLYGGNKNA